MRASKIPTRKSLQTPPPLALTDDEKIKAITVQPETGARTKLAKTYKSESDENKQNDNHGDKVSSSNQVARKINSRAAHSGMVLNLNPKKVTIVKPFNLGRTQEKSEVTGTGNCTKIPSPLCRSSSFKEKKSCKTNTEAIRMRRSMKMEIHNDSVKNIFKPLSSSTPATGALCRKVNRSKTEPAIKIDKYAHKKDDLKLSSKNAEEKAFEVLDLMTSEISKSVSGKISSDSRQRSLAHTGIKFIPTKPKKYFTLNAMKEETLKASGDGEAKLETAGDSNCSKTSSPLCRSSSLKEKSPQKSCKANKETSCIRRSMKQEIRDDSAKNISTPLSPTQTKDALIRKVNRSKTEPAIKFDKTAAKRDELKLLDKAEKHQFEISDLVSPEFSKFVSGKVPACSKKNSIGHSGIKFIPQKPRKSCFNFNIKREEMLQASENKK